MSTILYYSNFCQNCKKLLGTIAKSPVKDEMHFVCIDKRRAKNNGQTYITLQDGQEVLLPPSVKAVPALLLLNRGYHVLFGDEIMQHVKPSVDAMKQQAVVQTGEPMAYALGADGFGVASDNFSFLDQTSDEMSAKGTGGMRQQHFYASINQKDSIETPPETYQADTIGQVSMEQLQQQREMEYKNTNSK